MGYFLYCAVTLRMGRGGHLFLPLYSVFLCTEFFGSCLWSVRVRWIWELFLYIARRHRGMYISVSWVYFGCLAWGFALVRVDFTVVLSVSRLSWSVTVMWLLYDTLNSGSSALISYLWAPLLCLSLIFMALWSTIRILGPLICHVFIYISSI